MPAGCARRAVCFSLSLPRTPLTALPLAGLLRQGLRAGQSRASAAPGEPSFLLCRLWLTLALALQTLSSQASLEAFEKICSHARAIAAAYSSKSDDPFTDGEQAADADEWAKRLVDAFTGITPDKVHRLGWAGARLMVGMLGKIAQVAQRTAQQHATMPDVTTALVRVGPSLLHLYKRPSRSLSRLTANGRRSSQAGASALADRCTSRPSVPLPRRCR